MASRFSCQNLDLPDGKVSSSMKGVFSATSGLMKVKAFKIGFICD